MIWKTRMAPYAALRRIVSLFLALLTAAAAMTTGAAALEAPVITKATSAYLYNITGGTLLYTKNPDVKIYPGPTVKLMTAAVIIDELGESLQRKITIEKYMLDSVRGYNINLQIGEELTVDQLLHALIVGGSNDVAAVLAITAAGSVDAFVDMMNKKARQLGAVNTYYKNPNGIHDPDMITTASDTAKIALYAIGHGIFKDIAKLEYYTIPATNKSRERVIYSRNYFIATNIEYKYKRNTVNGVSAGSTDEAGYCVVATSLYNKSEYLCIVMGAEKDDEYIYSYVEAGKLLDWAYQNFDFMTVLPSSEIICEIPVKLSANMDYVTLMPEKAVELFLPNDTDLEKDISLSWSLSETSLTAPVSEGQVVGVATVLYKGKLVGRVNLVTKANIPRSEALYLLSILETVVSSGWFKLIAAASVLAAVIYVLANSVTRYRRSRRKPPRR